MKLHIVLLITAIVAVLAVAMTAEGRNTVSVTSTGSIHYHAVENGTLNHTDFMRTYYLPMTLEAINTTGVGWINMSAGSKAVTFNLTVNGVNVANGVLGPYNDWNETFTNLSAHGVDMTWNNLSIILRVPNANQELRWTNLTIMVDGATLSGTNWSTTVTGADVGTPTIGLEKRDSKYTVKDTVVASTTQTLNVNLTNVTHTFTYPSNAKNSPVGSYEIGNVTNTSSVSYELRYQKNGPYVRDVTSTGSGSTYTVDIEIYSWEGLKADFTIDTDSDDWADYFPGFSIDSIDSITLENKNVNYDTSGTDQIVMEDIKLLSGKNNMEIVYTSSAVAPPIIIPENPWYIEYWWAEAVVGLLIVLVYFGVWRKP